MVHLGMSEGEHKGSVVIFEEFSHIPALGLNLPLIRLRNMLTEEKASKALTSHQLQ